MRLVPVVSLSLFAVSEEKEAMDEHEGSDFEDASTPKLHERIAKGAKDQVRSPSVQLEWPLIRLRAFL